LKDENEFMGMNHQEIMYQKDVFERLAYVETPELEDKPEMRQKFLKNIQKNDITKKNTEEFEDLTTK
jgi:hypothetical protein